MGGLLTAAIRLIRRATLSIPWRMVETKRRPYKASFEIAGRRREPPRETGHPDKSSRFSKDS
jgi:hypothetical protein